MPKPPCGVLNEALRLHGRGWWVVPCAGKKPLRAGWNDRRYEPDELREVLAIPGRIIAVALGPSG